ncbi:MAG: M23 family metallopeptidase [Wenzhouxiangella sp.]
MPSRLSLIVTMLFVLPGPATAAPEVRLDGDVVQGGLVIGNAPPDSEVRYDGETLPVSDQGRFLVAFGRDQTDSGILEVILPDGSDWRRELTPEPREFDIQRIDGLPDEQVMPPDEVLERIREEARIAREARTRRDLRDDWAEGFIWPVTGPITGVYGSQRILNGRPRNPHWGIDIAAPAGTSVRAPASGLVTLVHDDMYFSGGTLFIDHGHGLVTAFLHLSEILVEDGERVERGQVVARVGATGRVTGAHLDWRMNLGDTRIDPALLVDWKDNPDATAP